MHTSPPTQVSEPFEKHSAPGTMPGKLRVYPGALPTTMSVLCYQPDKMVETTVSSIEELKAILDQDWTVRWLNVEGLADIDTLREIGEMFSLHRLALEDVVNVHQRPKVEPYEDHCFVVLRTTVASDEKLIEEQISLFFGKDFVLTFQERPGDCFGLVRDRIRSPRGRIRTAGNDYLAYALIDAVIDHYFPCIEAYGDCLDSLEDVILDDPSPRVSNRIHQIKRQLLVVRKIVWPMREAMSFLSREELDLITPETRLYLRDCYDHIVQVLDMVEVQRELASSQMDLYLSSVGQRTNEVMKVLTIFAAIFIPLSFIAGLYGMNFERDAEHPLNLPELGWAYGYPAVLGLMAAVAGGLLIFFWRKGWIGRRAN